MKLIDAIKEKGKPFHVKGCSREKDFLEFLKQMNLTTGVEIGVCFGKFTKEFAKTGFDIHGIDPWIGYSGAGRTEKEQKKQDKNYEIAKEAISPYQNCILIRKTSMEAVDLFKDNSLDFIYIDGDHRFPFIASDLYFWYQKVKSGGVISGHDYFNTAPHASNVLCHVKAAVDAFIDAFEIPNFYIFNEETKTLNWMFIKP